MPSSITSPCMIPTCCGSGVVLPAMRLCAPPTLGRVQRPCTAYRSLASYVGRWTCRTDCSMRPLGRRTGNCRPLQRLEESALAIPFVQPLLSRESVLLGDDRRVEQALVDLDVPFRRITITDDLDVRDVRELVRSARRTLVIVTPRMSRIKRSVVEAILSPLGAGEALARRVVPVLVDDATSGRGAISFLTPIVVPEQGDDQAWLAQIAVAVGRRRDPDVQPPPAPPRGWYIAHTPPSTDGFVGRTAELAALDHWIADSYGPPVMVITGLGGAGKTTLVWHWLSRSRPVAERLTQLVWWSFYEGEPSFAQFASAALRHLDAPRSLVSIEAPLVSLLRSRPAILVLDGLERVAGPEQVAALAEFLAAAAAGGPEDARVLVTSAASQKPWRTGVALTESHPASAFSGWAEC